MSDVSDQKGLVIKVLILQGQKLPKVNNFSLCEDCICRHCKDTILLMAEILHQLRER